MMPPEDAIREWAEKHGWTLFVSWGRDYSGDQHLVRLTSPDGMVVLTADCVAGSHFDPWDRLYQACFDLFTTIS